MSANLRAMTYNVRYDNPNDGEHAWPNRREHVANTIRFQRPDLIGLQEARPGQLADLRDLLGGFEWLEAGRSDGGHPGEYTVVGFDADRFDLLDDGTFWLSETPDEPSVGWDADLPRLARHVRLHDGRTDRELVHVNTHFDHRGERARRKSAGILRRRSDDLAPEGPLVLTADLNARPESEPYQVLVDGERPGRTHVDTHEVSTHPHHGPRTTMTDFHNLIPDKRIDYVFGTGDLDVVQHTVCSDTYNNGAYPSDHLPVVADLAVPEGG